MAKYVIEIPDEVKWIQGIKSTGFGTQDYGLVPVADLTPYTEPDEQEIRERAHEEAWRLASELMWSVSAEEIYDMPASHVFRDMTYSEAKAKYDQWKADKEKIHVGDEITIRGQKRVITSIDEEDIMAIDSDGATYGFPYDDINDIKRTGRTFPEVAELLKKMKEE